MINAKMTGLLENEDGYVFEEHEIRVPDHDTDLRIVLPDGRTLLFQWRVEYETVDICLSKDGSPLTVPVYLADAELQGMAQWAGGGEAQQITIIKED